MKVIIPRFFIFIFLILLSQLMVMAQTDAAKETSIGPFGGSASVLAVNPHNPKVIFAGTERGGLYKSTDRGSSWSKTALNTYAIRSINFSVTNENLIYVGAGTFFKSLDGGSNWSESQGISGLNALAVNPGHHQIIYAGTTVGIFQSVNGGVSWDLIGEGLPPTPYIKFLATSPAAPNLILASVANGSAYKSTDGGKTFHRLNISPGNLLIRDPTNANIAYTAVTSLTASGFFKSFDGVR